MNPSDLVAVSVFQSDVEAGIARDVLEDVGIESMIRSDDVGGMYPGIGGVELLVRAEDLEKAREALRTT